MGVLRALPRAHSAGRRGARSRAGSARKRVPGGRRRAVAEPAAVPVSAGGGDDDGEGVELDWTGMQALPATATGVEIRPRPYVHPEGLPPLNELERILLDHENDYEAKMALVTAYYEARPVILSTRIAEVAATASAIAATWAVEERLATPAEKRTRGLALKDGVQKLGPCFVKIAQTLSTRPDVVGDEVASSLQTLQDKMDPFDSQDAFATIAEELQWEGPVSPQQEGVEGEPLYAELGPEPIAAASLGQVYRGRTRDGVEVAVKVQRPGMYERIALDMHIARLSCKKLEEVWGIQDIEAIVDEVGSGLFRELNYLEEAANCNEFADAHAFQPFVKVPDVHAALTTRRVLTLEWLHGRPMKALSTEEQRHMTRMGVECAMAQMLHTGVMHADPHEGNLMYTDDGRLALIDFGLISRVSPAQQEALAGAILAVLRQDWSQFIDELRVIGMLPPQPAIWSDPETGEPTEYLGRGEWKLVSEDEFRENFAKSMTKRSQNKTSFTEVVVDLTEISTTYRFCLPPYMVLIIRSLTTLDGFAQRCNYNMYAGAAPIALHRVLTPRTSKGSQALRDTLLSTDNRVRWAELSSALSTSSSGAPEPERESPAGFELSADTLFDKRSTALRRVAYETDIASVVPPPALLKQMSDALRYALPALLTGALSGTRASAILSTAEARRRRRIFTVIAAKHVRRLLLRPTGIVALVRITAAAVGVVAYALLGALVHAIVLRPFRKVVNALWPERPKQPEPQPEPERRGA